MRPSGTRTLCFWGFAHVANRAKGVDHADSTLDTTALDVAGVLANERR
jgi:hypothetical protein